MSEQDLPDNLKELFGFIRGGPSGLLGTGIHTYPGSDENHERIYQGCLDLEKRGLVYRHFEKPGHICFMPVESVQTP